MSAEAVKLLWYFGLFVIMTFAVGFYCLLVTHNLIRALIGVEILIKAVTLLIITVGYVTGHAALAQALVITLIVIEVVVVTVAAGIILGIHNFHDSLDLRKIRNLKG